MTQDTMRALLYKAVEMEERGYKFYAETAHTAKNRITKKLFSFLAQQEIVHIEILKSFAVSSDRASDMPRTDFTAIAAQRLDELDLFSQTVSSLKEKIHPDDTEKDACQFAMELENTGYRFYESMRREKTDPALSRFIDFLLKEEGRHYELIMKIHEYITDSGNWNMYEEGSFPQG